MPVVPMQKIDILASKVQEKALIDKLHDLGVLELRRLPIEGEKEELKGFDLELAELRSSIGLLDKISPRKKNFNRGRPRGLLENRKGIRLAVGGQRDQRKGAAAFQCQEP